MNLLPLSVILQFFAPYWNSLGLPILEAADAAGKLIPPMEAIIPRIRYITKHGESVKALTDAMVRLKATSEGIMDDINIAEREGKGRTQEAIYWFKRVEAEESELATMEEACRKRKRVLRVPPLKWYRSYQDGKRASKKAKVVEELQTEARSIVVTRSLPPPSVQEMPPIRGLVAIESIVNKMLLRLDDGSVGIIAIWGMGGVGKTTLLSRINNSFLPGSDRSLEFDHVIWTVASKECTLEKLQKGIAQKLGLNLEARGQPPNMVLFEYLKRKNFLLLLDDLWRGFELEDVGIPHPGTSGNQYKRKVILTTRSQDVCRKMDAVEIKMNCLEPPEALDLFKFHVSEMTLSSHPDIPELARVVAEECRGLPLALKTIGVAMRGRRDPKNWRHIIKLLKESKHAEIQEMEILPEGDEERCMFRILKLSYDYLRNDRTRQCFLSCCLWPEDWKIRKDELIDCWKGLGFIDESNEGLFLGHECIRILEEACLLEPSEVDGTVRMHDVIRDLALWIASDCGQKKNKWLVRAGAGLKEEIDVKRNWIEAEAAERISLMRNDIEMLPQYLPDRPSLKVLMLQRNCSLRRIPPHLFQCMPALTHLDLSNTGLKELPKEIGILVQLQYLNLSFTRIEELPKELACLKELKYLLLSSISLLRIPRGAISNLSELRLLDLYRTEYARWQIEGCRGCGNEENTTNLEDLEELNSKVMLSTTLKITVIAVSTLQMLSRLDNVVTRWLDIWRMSSSASIQLTPSIIKAQLGSLKMLKGLQKLTIGYCKSLVELEVDGEYRDHDMDWRLPDLDDLQLFDLTKLKVVKWTRVSISDFLPQLRSVGIHCCNELENANWVLLLPRLEHLSIWFCPKMRQVIDDSIGSHVGHNSPPVFRCLRTLFLFHLVSLTSICDQAISFPSLKVIEIIDCDELKQLPIKIMGSNLQGIGGGEGWWQSLQWQDENVKASLLPCFRAI